MFVLVFCFLRGLIFLLFGVFCILFDFGLLFDDCERLCVFCVELSMFFLLKLGV